MNESDNRDTKQDAHRRSGDEFAARLLDESLAADKGTSMTESEKRRIADLQCLNALLEHSHGKYQTSIEHAISSALDQVRKAAPPVQFSKARWRYRSLTLTATVLLALGLAVCLPQGHPSAHAMVEQAYRAAMVETDRIYRVRLASEDVLTNGKESTLFVRGAKRFVLEHTGPLGGQTRIGSNGQEFWLIPPVGPVLVDESAQFANRWLDRTSVDMPLLQMTTILERMRDRYDLKLLPEERLVDDGPKLKHLRAHRRPDTAAEFPRSPETIELWAHANSGVIARLILIRNQTPRAAFQKSITVTVDFLKEETLAPNFYDYAMHSGTRPIMRAPQNVTGE